MRGAYGFAINGTGALAYVAPRNGSAANYGYATTVIYATAAELQLFSHDACQYAMRGEKSVGGIALGLGATENASLKLGSSMGFATGGGTAAPFLISNVADGPHDLIASRYTNGLAFPVTSKLIIRRGMNPANGSSMPALDFNSAEAVAPVVSTLSVAGVGGQAVFMISGFTTATGTEQTFTAAATTTGSIQYLGVPTASLAPGDLHELMVSVDDGAGAARLVLSFARIASDRTIEMGPSIGELSVSTVATSPSIRLRMQIPAQNAYAKSMVAGFFGGEGPGNRKVVLAVTANYLGAAPSAWSVTMPDLSTAAGYQASYGMTSQTGLKYTGVLTGGNQLFFAAPVDGALLAMAQRRVSTVSAARVPHEPLSPAASATRRLSLPWR